MLGAQFAPLVYASHHSARARRAHWVRGCRELSTTRDPHLPPSPEYRHSDCMDSEPAGLVRRCTALDHGYTDGELHRSTRCTRHARSRSRCGWRSFARTTSGRPGSPSPAGRGNTWTTLRPWWPGSAGRANSAADPRRCRSRRRPARRCGAGTRSADTGIRPASGRTSPPAGVPGCLRRGQLFRRHGCAR